MRLWQGEHDLKGSQLSKCEARCIFLWFIETRTPKVLKELHRRVFPIYQVLRLELEDLPEKIKHWRQKCGERVLIAKHERDLRWSTIKQAEGDFYPDLLALKNALLRWAAGFYLEDDWVLDTAVDTLNLWHWVLNHQGELDGDTLCWDYPSEGFWPGKPPVFEPSKKAGWKTLLETKTAYKKRIMEEIKQELEKYLDMVERQAEEAGITGKVKEKEALEHFEWLVKYQIKRYDYVDIAREYYKRDDITSDSSETKAVKQGIGRTAKFIGLTLRPGKAGRPPKNT